MSFSGEIKAELCKVEAKRPCCLGAECYGAWLFSRCFTLRDSAWVTESASAARRAMELCAAAAGASAQLSYAVSRRQKPAYRVTLPEPADRARLLDAFGHSGYETSLRINRAPLEEDCCVQAFLRGAFLTCGTATDPNKGYHLEYAVPHKNLARDLYTLLGEIPAFRAAPAIVQRKGGYAVYLKESGQIENLLTYLGAPRAAMELMQVKMFKEARNNINRQTNFETANMDKTFSASARQTAAIAAISDTVGLDALPPHLGDLARLRLQYPDMTLRDLGQRLHISRSGVNHRLQRLLELGEKILEEKGVENIL